MAAEDVAGSMPRTRVLVVDDDEDLADTIREALELRAFHAGSCRSPLEAIARLEAATWDVLVSDISMPGMSGYQLLDIVRGRWPRLHVILMTALPDAAAGVPVRVLRKPFAITELVGAISALVPGGW